MVGELLKAKTIRVDTGSHFCSHSDLSLDMEEEQFEYIVKRYKEFSHRAANLDYKIGPENHTGSSLSPKNSKKLQWPFLILWRFIAYGPFAGRCKHW